MIVKHFNQSKLYKLYSESSDLFFIGTTTIKNIQQKLSKHRTEAKHNAKSVLSKFILDQDPKQLQIEVLFEYVDFTSDEELNEAKKEYLNNMSTEDNLRCINKMKKYNIGERKAGRELRNNKKELLKIKKRVDKLVKEAETDSDTTESDSE